jgi:hypothetical protein
VRQEGFGRKGSASGTAPRCEWSFTDRNVPVLPFESRAGHGDNFDKWPEAKAAGRDLAGGVAKRSLMEASA